MACLLWVFGRRALFKTGHRRCASVEVRSPNGEPVTNFTHNNYLYRLAMRYNRGLDRDRDGIACEKL
jgi:hypothetical protein